MIDKLVEDIIKQSWKSTVWNIAWNDIMLHKLEILQSKPFDPNRRWNYGN